MSINRIHLAMISFLFATPTAMSQAYCALRDPVTQIYEIFPNADSYRSIVRTIDQTTRTRIYEQLPFTLHFNELGRHTLYVPLRGTLPLGLVHVRSESGSWGLLEVAWSLTPNLEIIDFAFQRYRSRHREALEAEQFRAQLRGKSFAELRELLAEDGATLKPNALTIETEAIATAATLIRSALKTILVTDYGWEQDLKLVRILVQAYTAFPKGTQVQVFDKLYSPRTTARLEEILGEGYRSAIHRPSTLGLRVLDGDGELIGFILKTQWNGMHEPLNLWWQVTPDQVLQGIKSEQGWPDPNTQDLFLSINGLSLTRLHQCSSTVETLGAEVLILTQTLTTEDR